jgi:hypothetical protein
LWSHDRILTVGFWYAVVEAFIIGNIADAQ